MVKKVENRKVLFIDSWTRASGKFSPIAKRLKADGIQSLLVHRGSWVHDLGRPMEEMIGDLQCRDFRYYNTRFIYKIMKYEKPYMVVVLTTNYLFDRAVVLAAKALGIKSCFLMHGIRSVIPEVIARQKTITNNSLKKKRWQKATKLLFYTIPNYFLSGMIQNKMFLFRKEPYSILIRLFINPHRYLLFPTPSSEFHCDLALVWGNVYKEFFIKEYGYPESNVKLVGHPPLDSVFNLLNNPPDESQKLSFLKEHFINSNLPYCVLLEDGAVEQGSNGWNTETRLQFLDDIAQVCLNAGRYLIIKLHPSTEAKPIHTYFLNHDHVDVIERIDLNKLIYWADAIIGQGSTTNDIAIIMNKPLLLPAWGVSEIPNQIVYKRHPFAELCASQSELYDAIQNNSFSVDSNKLRSNYIDEYITFTDGKANERIVNFIIEAQQIKTGD